MSGLEFSKFSIARDIVDEYYYDKYNGLDQPVLNQKTAEVMPLTEQIFAKYPCDTEFEASCEYDIMEEELAAVIHPAIDKMEYLPF